MSAILKFDFQKRKQLHFLEKKYLNYTKKRTILYVTITFSLKQGQTRTSSGPMITLPLTVYDRWIYPTWNNIIILRYI